jgi:hypothetical protein
MRYPGVSIEKVEPARDFRKFNSTHIGTQTIMTQSGQWLSYSTFRLA